MPPQRRRGHNNREYMGMNNLWYFFLYLNGDSDAHDLVAALTRTYDEDESQPMFAEESPYKQTSAISGSSIFRLQHAHTMSIQTKHHSSKEVTPARLTK